MTEQQQDHDARGSWAWAALGCLAALAVIAARAEGSWLGVGVSLVVLAIANVKAWRRYVDANWPGHREQRRGR